MLSAPAVPVTLEQVTPEWLTAALDQRYPGTQVLSMRHGTIIRGMATKAQLFLTYNDAGKAHGLPESLWVKSGFDALNDELRAHNQTEACFFRDLAPSLSINIPKTWLELVDPPRHNGLMLFEDLTARNVTFGRQTTPLEPDEMLRVLDLQAGYHGAFWKDRRLEAFDWLTVGGMIVSSNVCDIFLGFWDMVETLPRFDFVPPQLRDPALIRRAIQTLHANDAREANCIVHGDAHQSNLFFDPDGTPGYLDWASVMRGHWAFDVSYVLVGSQRVEDRRRLQRDQLAYYLDRLSAITGEVIPFDEAWLAYRQHAMWMFMTTLCPVELHPEELCMINAERACAAIVDLDTVASLGL